MNENRLGDYLEHMQQAAEDACTFVDGLPGSQKDAAGCQLSVFDAVTASAPLPRQLS